jgi:hypothetical protein
MQHGSSLSTDLPITGIVVELAIMGAAGLVVAVFALVAMFAFVGAR